MPDVGTTSQTETPTPAPIGELTSIAEYRARRTEATDPAATAAPTPEPEAAAATVVSEPATEPDPSKAGKTLAAKKGSLQARIDEITGEKHRTAAERDEARAALAALQAELAALKAGKTAEPAAAAAPAADVADPSDPEPSIDKYESWEQFTRDHGRWAARQELKAYRATEQAQAAEAALRDGQARVAAEGAQAHDDFDAVVSAYEAGGGTYAPAVQDAIVNHPLGAEFAYRLAKTPALAARVNQPNLAAAYFEIGRVMAAIEAEHAPTPEPTAAPKPKPMSKAPAVIAAPESVDAPAGLPDPAKMTSVREWRRLREKFAAA